MTAVVSCSLSESVSAGREINLIGVEGKFENVSICTGSSYGKHIEFSGGNITLYQGVERYLEKRRYGIITTLVVIAAGSDAEHSCC